MPVGLAIPIITALGQGLQSYFANKSQNQQQQNQNESIDMQRQRLLMERAQQLRGNAMQDAQNSALNPVRANLFASLAPRLGLSASAFAVGHAPSAPGRTAMPSQMTPAGQATSAPSDPYTAQAQSEGEYSRVMAEADRLAQNPFTRNIADQLRQQARMKYPQLAGGQ